ncbi:alpha/beta hydrolase [Trichloromonas sp.]|uniref:alpha/beta hydrolase n=1 Tax=Trichloromonas sp. TaxID=3069249 RepID=UPI002A451862|nr:alpha/beta fold hydrolase [Trichloromonas sp.]
MPAETTPAPPPTASPSPPPVSPDNRSFFLDPKGPARGAALLVHGFTASPWEMRPLGEALADAGYLVLGVRLPGHGTTVADLSGRRYEEWLAAVAEGYRQLTARNLPVFGVGMSTGALLLLALATRERFAGLALLSPFLRLRHRLAPLVGLLRHVKRHQRRHLPEHLTPYYYDRRPLNGIHQIRRLIRQVEPVLDRITAPTLVLSAQGDRTVDAASAHRLYHRLGSPRKELYEFGPEVGHDLATRENPRWEETRDRLLDFFSGLPAGG